MATLSVTLTVGGKSITHTITYSTSSTNTTVTASISRVDTSTAGWNMNGVVTTVSATNNAGTGLDTVYSGVDVSSQSLSRSYTWNKGTSAKTVCLGLQDIYDTWSKANQVVITVPALQSYTVSYNANGGTGGPSTQTKYYSVDLSLTTSTPTRSGYRFVNWNTAADGSGTTYASGGTYSGNAAVTLYAQWKALPTISNLTVTRVDSNDDADEMGSYLACSASWTADASVGGSSVTFTCGSASETVSVSGSSGTATATLAASARADTPSIVTATVEDAADYTASTSYTSTTAYTAPSITSLACARTDQFGVLADEGEYMRVTVGWRVANIGSQTKPTSLVVTASSGGTTVASQTATSFTPTASGNIATGLVDFVMSAGAVFDTEHAYNVSTTLSDSLGSSTASDILSAAYYPFDILGDALLYNLTEDTAVDSSKTYYMRSGSGSKTDPYVYEVVESPEDEGLGVYYEANGVMPGHGASFGAPSSIEGFNVSMPPYVYMKPVLPTYFTDSINDYDPPYEPCLAVDTRAPELWYCHEENDQLVKDRFYAPYYIPAGKIYPYAGSTVPDGYLLCDGSAVSRADYAKLFEAIGTTYGTGDGSTTFNLPNLQGRVPVGASSSYSMGATGGEATHVLTPSETASKSHRHGMSHGHNFTQPTVNGGATTTGGGGGHAHTSGSYSSGFLAYITSTSGGYDFKLWTDGSMYVRTRKPDSVSNHTHGQVAHTHSVSGGKVTDMSGYTEYTSDADGSAHNNMQPYQVVKYIISIGGYYGAIKGDPAGFGTVSATVDSNVGTPSVTVTATGPDTAKEFSFAFSNLKGETGDDAGFGTISASVDSNVGTPSVTVTTSGPDTAKEFHFEFENMKGEKGEPFTIEDMVEISAGAIFPFGGSTAPDGFLMCDGSAVNRETYADLFAAIGTTYGVGDGSTTFNVPDLRGRTPIGSSTGHALGTTGGAETVSTYHKHVASDMRAKIGSASGEPNTLAFAATDALDPNTGATQNSTYRVVGASWSSNSGFSHYTPVVGYTDYQGSSTTNNMQPYATVNYIIATGKKYPAFRGEKGDKGDKGDTGATGSQGPKGDTGDMAQGFYVGTTEPAANSSYFFWFNPDTGAVKMKNYVTPDTYTDGGWAWRELVFADTGKNGDVYNATADAPSAESSESS